ncbi:MAG TPA: hypothetical protein VEZ19_14975 [Rubrobacter sp.]|nr:hypothetical protein [Rubrobacter sp.]
MAVRSRPFVFYEGAPASGSYVIPYVVPAGRTALVKHVSWSNRSSAVVDIRLGVRRGTAHCWILASFSLAHGSVARFIDAALVLEGGDALVFIVDRTGGGAAACTYYAAGALLDGLPT